jgi:hypothetical protein
MKTSLIRIIIFAVAAALASALSNSKIYEDPPKSLAQLSDEFKTLTTSPVSAEVRPITASQARSRSPSAKYRPISRSSSGSSAAPAICLTPPCETEDIMVSHLLSIPIVPSVDVRF